MEHMDHIPGGPQAAIRDRAPNLTGFIIAGALSLPVWAVVMFIVL